jgi:transposase
LDRTRRTGGKNGRKRSLLTDGRGIPLSLVVSGANVHDVKLLESTRDSLVVARPQQDPAHPRHLCADAGYKGEPARKAVADRNYRLHIKQRKEETQQNVHSPDRRPAGGWSNEPTHGSTDTGNSWSASKKQRTSYKGLLALAASLICWRQTITIYG